MSDKGRKTLVVFMMAVCMFMSSICWMYMRIPQYMETILRGSDLATWLPSVYIIAEVSMVIVAGTLIDRIGSKNCILIGMALFVGGSFGICIADTVELMVFLRVMQGLGAGFLFTVSLAFIPKLFPKSKRIRPHGLMSLMFSVGSIIGTATGYYFVFTVGDWRLFLAIAGAVVAICGSVAYFYLPEAKRESVRDIPGLVLSIVTVAAVMLYTQMVNKNFELFSWESLALFELAAVLFFLLILVEKRTKDPIIPHGIKKTHIGFLAGLFLAGFCGIGMFQFLTLFLMVTYRFTLYQATGTLLLFLIAGGATTSVIGMFSIYEYGIRPFSIASPILVFIGFVSAFFLIDKGWFGVGMSLYIMGLGFGCIITEMLVSIQAYSPVKHTGTYTGLLMSVRFMGIILGMGVYMGLIRTALTDYIENVKGEVTDDVIQWLFEHLGECINDMLEIFKSTVQQCCIIAAVAIIPVLIISYLMIGKEDLNAPEWLLEDKEEKNHLRK